MYATDAAILLVSPGLVAILDATDYDRTIATYKDGLEFLVKPCDTKWRSHNRKDGRKSVITTIYDENNKPIGVTLHSLVVSSKDSAEPLNGSFFDCRTANWAVPTHMVRCKICGALAEKKKLARRKRLAGQYLVYVFEGTKLVQQSACSPACKQRAELRTKNTLELAKHCNSIGSVVYFLADSASNKIKIGFSSNIEKRLSSLQTGNSSRLRLVGTIPGTKKTERQWHTQWAANRVNGEWFKKTDDLSTAIKAAISRTPPA
mgnify:CR=1 FL=1